MEGVIMKLLSSLAASRSLPAAAESLAPAADRGKSATRAEARRGAGGGWLLAAMLVAAAWGLYSHVYEPARAARATLEEKLRTASARQADKQRRLEAMREKCAELERGDPETMREVIRQELNKGATDEYFK